MVLERLPVRPPVRPMLAKLAREIPERDPTGEGWVFEPKWDGFRCIVFRDGDEMVMSSRRSRPFDRYFPELRGPLADALPERAVVDGEIVVPDPARGGLDFDALAQRIHPAASRVAALAASTPASFVAFDLLALDDRSLLDVAFVERRRLLVEHLAHLGPGGPVHLTPASTDPDVAHRWFTTFEGAGLDGVIAKPASGTYQPDRRALVKVKHERTADCVVAGYRVHKDGAGVGSLLLGLFDGDGRLHHVGVTASFTAARRAELLDELAPLTVDAVDGHPWRDWADAAAHADGRLPGGVSRWNAGKDLAWVPLRVERVVEVTFGQLEGGRFRHGSRFVRWRPDRDPASCRYDQLEVARPVDFAAFIAGGG